MARSLGPLVLLILGGILLSLAIAKAAATLTFNPTELQNNAESACQSSNGSSEPDCTQMFYLSTLIVDLIMPSLCGIGGIVLLVTGAFMSPRGDTLEIESDRHTLV
jgi:hypothetical protein